MWYGGPWFRHWTSVHFGSWLQFWVEVEGQTWSVREAAVRSFSSSHLTLKQMCLCRKINAGICWWQLAAKGDYRFLVCFFANPVPMEGVVGWTFMQNWMIGLHLTTSTSEAWKHPSLIPLSRTIPIVLFWGDRLLNCLFSVWALNTAFEFLGGMYDLQI